MNDTLLHLKRITVIRVENSLSQRAGVGKQKNWAFPIYYLLPVTASALKQQKPGAAAGAMQPPGPFQEKSAAPAPGSQGAHGNHPGERL